MKITDAKVFVCSPGRNFVTLKIYTDDGVYGLGDCTLNGRELSVATYLTDHVIPCIIGRDPFQTEDIWQYLYRGAYWRKGPVTMSAIAAVDVALWDIKAKALNTPLYNLLGGLSRTGVMGNLLSGWLVPVFTAPVVLGANGLALILMALYFFLVQRRVAAL